MKLFFRSTKVPGCLLILMAVLMVRSAGPAVADPNQLPAAKVSFTAETTVIYGGDTLEMKTLHRGSWERQEFIVDDLMQVTILRPDRNRAYVMFLQSRQLFEMPYNEVALLPTMGMLRGFETKRLPDSEVEGEAVAHFQVSRGVGDGMAQEDATTVLDLWVTPDGIVMRAEGEIMVDGYREPLQLTRRNVRRQALDPGLFEPSIAIEP